MDFMLNCQRRFCHLFVLSFGFSGVWRLERLRSVGRKNHTDQKVRKFDFNSCVHFRSERDKEGINRWFWQQAVVKVWKYPLWSPYGIKFAKFWWYPLWSYFTVTNHSLGKVYARLDLKWTQRLRSKRWTWLLKRVFWVNCSLDHPGWMSG